MTIIDYIFGEPGMGSFEHTLCKAWQLASSDNRKRLENAFPDHFPVARMYGVTPFYEFASKEQFEKAVLPYIVKMNQWGKTVEAVKMPWADIHHREHTPCLYPIERREFERRERAYGDYIDPATGNYVECLCFADYKWGDNILWYVTDEKLEEIED